MQKNEHVLIIGGGIAGLAVSIFLKRAGIKATIFESKPSNDESGAGFVLTPNGFKVLQSLDCEQEILQNSTVIKSMHMINQENDEVFVQRDYSDKYYNSAMINITRANLANVLLKKANHLGIEVKYNKKLDGLKQSNKGVLATFEDGSTVEGHILIGADGTFSKTRTNIFPSLKLDYAGIWGVQGVSSIEDTKLNLSAEFYGYMGKNNFLLCFAKCHPTNQDNILWQAIGVSPEKLPINKFEKGSLNNIKAKIYDLMKDWNIDKAVYNMLENTKTLYPRSIYSIGDLPSWSQGRVVLIGDALHTTNPLVGQGASFSLEDAMYLAKMLKEHDYRDAFYYFEADRRPRTKKITEHFLMNQEFDLEDFINNYNIKWESESLIN
ncbi:FAD-dependent oxidoreductase [Cytobacillus sp. FSL K6-0265]|uniref:FAD-dependent oxidoreductase n=1 Tax=Cytobacillus sp. FSL K6-0265 TaxID=2921448 RepID=UPI0030F6D6E5